MKIFIDLGAYTGDTIIAAFRNNEGYEKYIAFEPDADNVKKLRENLQFLPNVEIVEAAAYVKNEVVQFHKHIDEGVRQDAKEGGTLERTKKNVSQDNVAMVTGIDFAEYLQKNVREQDHVVLKIDIEGSEYDLLQHLIDTNAISLVDELYCEWHKHKVSGKDEIHKQLVAKLQSLGFNITGENSHDEFSQIKRNLLLSIVIPTFNRSSVVCSLLKSLHTQTDPHFEVVVVSDGSPDDTVEVVKKISSSLTFGVQVFDTNLKDVYGLATARNLGITKARGEAVVILDDDSFPEPEFVAEHKKTVAPKTWTGGPRKASTKDEKLDEKNALYEVTYGDSVPKKIIPIPKYKWIVENNTCMFKKDWIESGLFDESIKAYGGIGQKFNEQLIAKGYLYQFNPRAVIIHKTEYKQNHLYVRIKPKKIKHLVLSIAKKIAPGLYSKLKTIKDKLGK